MNNLLFIVVSVGLASNARNEGRLARMFGPEQQPRYGTASNAGVFTNAGYSYSNTNPLIMNKFREDEQLVSQGDYANAGSYNMPNVQDVHRARDAEGRGLLGTSPKLGTFWGRGLLGTSPKLGTFWGRGVGDCVSHEGYQDTYGDGCEFYDDGNQNFCGTADKPSDTAENYGAKDACCACGGGYEGGYEDARQVGDLTRDSRSGTTAVSRGCWSLTREQCCGRHDGRQGDYYNEICLPATSSYTSGNVCEPKCWVEGRCGWRNAGYQANIGTCPRTTSVCNTDAVCEAAYDSDKITCVDGMCEWPTWWPQHLIEMHTMTEADYAQALQNIQRLPEIWGQVAYDANSVLQYAPQAGGTFHTTGGGSSTIG